MAEDQDYSTEREGEDEAIRSKDESRAAALAFLGFAAPIFCGLRDFNLGDRWTNALGGSHNCARVSVEQNAITI